MDVAEAVPDDGQVATATAKPLFSLSLCNSLCRIKVNGSTFHISIYQL
jgi:hypothetical protein